MLGSAFYLNELQLVYNASMWTRRLIMGSHQNYFNNEYVKRELIIFTNSKASKNAETSQKYYQKLKKDLKKEEYFINTH